MYAFGIGIAKDPVQGAAWYQKAADQGLYTAQYYLSWSYFTGAGVAVDSAAGYKWLYLASTRDKENKDYRARKEFIDTRIHPKLMERGMWQAADWLKRRGEI